MAARIVLHRPGSEIARCTRCSRTDHCSFCVARPRSDSFSRSSSARASAPFVRSAPRSASMDVIRSPNLPSLIVPRERRALLAGCYNPALTGTESEGRRMEYRRLGNSGLKVSVIGLGSNTFGATAEEAGSIEVIHTAIEMGVNYIDTANVYSFGTSEEYVGKAIKGRRHELVIGTKVGVPM